MSRYIVRIFDIERRAVESSRGKAIEEKIIGVTERGPYRSRLWAWLVCLGESAQDDFSAHRCEVIKLDADQTQESDGA